MRLLIDLLYITNEDPSGIKKYGFKLISDIPRYTEGIEVGVLCNEALFEYVVSEIGQCYNFIVVSNEEKNIISKDYSIYRESFPEKACIIESYDFIISTCANYPIALFSPYIKHVGVIHDLQMLKLMWKARNFIKTIYRYFDTKRRIRKLDYIVTISKQTQLAIKKFANKESKIIYYALEPPTREENKPQNFPFVDTEKYILDVNTFYKYKNADLLLKAFAIIHKDYPCYRLYFKGNYNYEFERLPKLAESLGILNKVYFDLSKLTENEISWLYSNASIFVSPSKMEGFGATPIESITHNTPVIVSNIETLKEVVKDCGVFFDPNNVNELANKIKEEISKPTPMEELERRKKIMLELYSREKQVNNYIDFLNSL